jgi:hypothetical protein
MKEPAVAAFETIQVRRAALLLHGLPVDARRRIIARLDDPAVGELEQMLGELDRLGVPSSLGQHLQTLAAEPPSASDDGLSPSEQLDRCSASDIVSVLKQCATVTAANLLQARAWSWKQEVLSRLSELRRAEVLRLLRSGQARLPPAVLNALCKRVCREIDKLHQRSVAAPAVVDTKRSRWFAWMR